MDAVNAHRHTDRQGPVFTEHYFFHGIGLEVAVDHPAIIDIYEGVAGAPRYSERSGDVRENVPPRERPGPHRVEGARGISAGVDALPTTGYKKRMSVVLGSRPVGTPEAETILASPRFDTAGRRAICGWGQSVTLLLAAILFLGSLGCTRSEPPQFVPPPSPAATKTPTPEAKPLKRRYRRPCLVRTRQRSLPPELTIQPRTTTPTWPLRRPPWACSDLFTGPSNTLGTSIYSSSKESTG